MADSSSSSPPGSTWSHLPVKDAALTVSPLCLPTDGTSCRERGTEFSLDVVSLSAILQRVRDHICGIKNPSLTVSRRLSTYRK